MIEFKFFSVFSLLLSCQFAKHNPCKSSSPYYALSVRIHWFHPFNISGVCRE